MLRRKNSLEEPKKQFLNNCNVNLASLDNRTQMKLAVTKTVLKQKLRAASVTKNNLEACPSIKGNLIQLKSEGKDGIFNDCYWK